MSAGGDIASLKSMSGEKPGKLEAFIEKKSTVFPPGLKIRGGGGVEHLEAVYVLGAAPPSPLWGKH